MANMAFRLAKISPHITKAMIEDMGFNCKECTVESTEPLAWTFFLWAITVKKYLMWREQGINIVAVRYEDLEANPASFVTAILDHFELPLEWQNDALKGMALDSQRNSTYSRVRLINVALPVLTPQVKNVLNSICHSFNLPLPGEPCVLDGTISGL
jgi:hypothetical protein